MLNPTFPLTGSSGGGTDPALAGRVTVLETDVQEIQSRETVGFVYPDVQTTSTVVIDNFMSPASTVFGDLSGLTFTISDDWTSADVTFDGTEPLVYNVFQIINMVCQQVGAQAAIHGYGPYALVVKMTGNRPLSFELSGTALAALGFEAGTFANEQTQRTYAATSDFIYDSMTGVPVTEALRYIQQLPQLDNRLFNAESTLTNHGIPYWESGE